MNAHIYFLVAQSVNSNKSFSSLALRVAGVPALLGSINNNINFIIKI